MDSNFGRTNSTSYDFGPSLHNKRNMSEATHFGKPQ